MPRGAFPVVPTTPVGRARLLVGDTVSVPLTPPEVGFQDFAVFGDDELAMAIQTGSGSVTRGVGIAIKQLALAAARIGQSIKADDFAIDTQGRGSDLLEIAESYMRQADEEDARYAREGDPFAEDVDAEYAGLIIVNTRLKRSAC